MHEQMAAATPVGFEWLAARFGKLRKSPSLSKFIASGAEARMYFQRFTARLKLLRRVHL